MKTENEREQQATQWKKSPEELLDSISDETGLGWDVESILFLLQTFIRTHATPEEFLAHARRAAEFELSQTEGGGQ